MVVIKVQFERIDTNNNAIRTGWDGRNRSRFSGRFIESQYGEINTYFKNEIASAIFISQTLTSLHLSQTYISDLGAKHLAEALKVNQVGSECA